MGNTNNKHGKKNYRKNNSGSSDTKSRNMDKRVHIDAERDNANDVAWYTLYPQLVSDACNINYGYPLGSKLNFRARSNPLYEFAEGERATTSGNASWSVPGAMALYVTPTIGRSTDETSPINIAARNIYSYVRHANSGHANYDAPDLMLYLISMDTAYSLHAFLKRIYGLMRVMDPMNRYMNKAIVEGMGVDFDDINANLAQFRALINRMAVKVGALCIPASMSYFARHMWMYSGIYYDEELRKAQMYFYTPYNFWKYNEVDGAGQLDYVPFMELTADSGLWTFQQLSGLVDEIYESLMYSEDINIMSGDILKAYGEENIFKLSLTPDDYMVVPTFNAEVLVQIQNAYVNNGASMVIDPIKQDPTTGVLSQRIYSNTQTPILEGVKMLTVPTNAPTPALTMVATRLTSIPIVSEDGNQVEYDSFGSEVITAGAICSFSSVGGVWTHQWDLFSSDMVFNFESGYSSENTLKHRVINKLTSFNFHPEVKVYTKNINNSGQYMTMSGRLFSVFNYALVDENDLRSMHEAALLSEFYVPQNGALVR